MARWEEKIGCGPVMLVIRIPNTDFDIYMRMDSIESAKRTIIRFTEWHVAFLPPGIDEGIYHAVMLGPGTHFKVIDIETARQVLDKMASESDRKIVNIN